MLPSEPQAIQDGDSQENNSPTRTQSTQIYNDLAECSLSPSNATDLVLTQGDPLIITSPHDLSHETSSTLEPRQRAALAWPIDTGGIAVTRQDGTAVPLSTEGGVIVLGKVQQDGTVSALLPRDDCQDIVLMVELKYNKDMLLPELQGQHVLPQIQRDGSLKQAIKARIVNYVADSDGAARQVIKGPQVDNQASFAVDSSLSKTNLLTYDSQGHPQNTCIAYTANQPIALAKETLSYIPDGQTLGNTHTITFEDSSQLATLTKEQALSLMAGTGVLPNAQIISFAPDPGTNVGQITRTHLVSYTSDSPATEFVDTGVVVDPMLADLVYESENIPTEVPEMKPDIGDGLKPPLNEKPFPCTVCHKRFMRRTNLRSHMAHHTSERPHRCETCGKSFALRWDLTLHLRLHTGVLSCEVCGKAFSVPGKLERHRRIHSGERPYSCTQCGKAFSDKHNLEAHIRTHSDERPFSCQTCGNTFRSKSHLRAHRRVHSQDTPFACEICGKVFKWKANLNLHLKGHAGERAKCDGCGREFARAADLARHRRSHEGLRPHPCTMCSRTYIDRGALNKHMKSHTEERPYVCDICHKGFHYQWYLTAHKKVHESEGQDKKFRCDFCDKEYSKKSTLNAHMKTHARTGTVIENAQLADSSENVISIVSTMTLSPDNTVESGGLAVAGDHTMSSDHTVSSDHSMSVDNPVSSDQALSTELAVSAHTVAAERVISDHAMSVGLEGSADHAVSSDRGQALLADHVLSNNAVSSDHALSSDHSNLTNASSLEDTKTSLFLTTNRVDQPTELVMKTVLKTEVDVDSTSSMEMTAA